jgi:hypothetical protein
MAKSVIGVLGMLVTLVGQESLLGLILRQTRSEIASLVNDEQRTADCPRDQWFKYNWHGFSVYKTQEVSFGGDRWPGRAFFQAVCRKGLEGVVAKRLDGRYQAGTARLDQDQAISNEATQGIRRMDSARGTLVSGPPIVDLSYGKGNDAFV